LNSRMERLDALLAAHPPTLPPSAASINVITSFYSGTRLLGEGDGGQGKRGRLAGKMEGGEEEAMMALEEADEDVSMAEVRVCVCAV